MASSCSTLTSKCFFTVSGCAVPSNAVFPDGAPAHSARQVRTFLDQPFLGRGLERNGLLVWAARSPDLTRLDFFVCGFLKTKVYERKPKTLQQLQNFICDEAEKITPVMCDNAVAGKDCKYYNIVISKIFGRRLPPTLKALH